MMEFDTYKAVYCGLCKQLGSSFGPFARFTLNYDFAFLSLLALGVAPECRGYAQQCCAANPLKKKPCLCRCDESMFAASVAMAMMYYKVRDNFHDAGFGGKLGAALLTPFASYARKKAKKLYPQMDEIIRREMQRQSEAEENFTSVDAAAEPSARALAELTALIPASDNDRLVLYRIGYLVGRWVYLMDALDDLEEDQKNGSFNPYLKKFGSQAKKSEIREYAAGMLQLTAGELSNTYELLGLKRYKPILDNIIYLGLKNTMNLVLSGKKSKKNREAELFE